MIDQPKQLKKERGRIKGCVPQLIMKVDSMVEEEVVMEVMSNNMKASS